MRTLLSVGHGYSAAALARALLAQGGWRVIGTTRKPERLAAIAATGVDPVLWSGGPLPLAGVTHLLSSVAPTAAGDPVLLAAGAQLAGAGLSWIGYLSTTAVYGDRAGGWVDEAAPLVPATERGHWRVAAERAWAALPNVQIFRLAGIYGPGRGPLEKVRAGAARRIVKPGQVFSRIHVDDIARVLAASIARPRPGGVYNVCDDAPAPPEDVLAYAARLLGLPPPPEVAFDQADLSPMAASFYAENKRVRNDRIKTELGVRLAYPDYRAGLSALARGSGAGG